MNYNEIQSMAHFKTYRTQPPGKMIINKVSNYTLPTSEESIPGKGKEFKKRWTSEKRAFRRAYVFMRSTPPQRAAGTLTKQNVPSNVGGKGINGSATTQTEKSVEQLHDKELSMPTEIVVPVPTTGAAVDSKISIKPGPKQGEPENITQKLQVKQPQPPPFFIEMAITKESKDSLTSEESEQVRKSLEAILWQMTEEPPVDDEIPTPNFRGFPTYKDGALHISCKDEVTAVWLEKIVSEIRPIGEKLTVTPINHPPRKTRCLLKAPGVPTGRSVNDVIQRLQFQNRELDITNWPIHEWHRDKSELLITLDVPEDKLEILRELSCCLEYGMSIVYVKILGKVPPKPRIKPGSESQASVSMSGEPMQIDENLKKSNKQSKGSMNPKEWWTPELLTQRTHVRKLHNRAMNTKKPEDMVIYRKELNLYKKQIRARTRLKQRLDRISAKAAKKASKLLESASNASPSTPELAAEPSPLPSVSAAKTSPSPPESAAKPSPSPPESAAKPSPSPPESTAKPSPTPPESAVKPPPSPPESHGAQSEDQECA